MSHNISTSITKRVDDGTICYCSIHNDGSSSAKTMGEKELHIIRTAHNCKVKSHIISMEEPDEATNEGLKAALENSIMKLGLMIDRKEQEVPLRHSNLKFIITKKHTFAFSKSYQQ